MEEQEEGVEEQEKGVRGQGGTARATSCYTEVGNKVNNSLKYLYPAQQFVNTYSIGSC